MLSCAGTRPSASYDAAMMRRLLVRLGVAVGASILVSGCAVSEVSHTRNGETVDPSESDVPDWVDDVEPCGLDGELLERLGVVDMDLTEGGGSTPTCSWEVNAFTSPRMYYWVKGPSEPDPANEVIEVAGVEAEIFLENPVDARYIVRTEEFTLDVAYLSDAVESPELPDGPTGAELVVASLLEKLEEVR